MTTTVSDTIDVHAPVRSACEAWRTGTRSCVIGRIREMPRLGEARFHWRDREMSGKIERIGRICTRLRKTPEDFENRLGQPYPTGPVS